VTVNPTFDFWSYALGAVTAVIAFALLASDLLPAEIRAWREKRADKRLGRDAVRARQRAGMPRHSSSRRAWRTGRSVGRHSLTEMDTVAIPVPAVQAALAQRAEVSA
jgi:hypothetical protein